MKKRKTIIFNYTTGDDQQEKFLQEYFKTLTIVLPMQFLQAHKGNKMEIEEKDEEK